MGREAKFNNNLTRKQMIFVQKILEGETPSQAALVAYKTKSKKVAASIAHENLNKPDIQAAIRQALSVNGLSIANIVNNIGTIANSEPRKITGETKLKANIELLKLMGAYTDQRTSTQRVNIRSNIASLTYMEAKNKLTELQASAEEFMLEAEYSK